MFDVVISGGHVVDGTGAPPWRADVGVTDGRIAALGRLANAPAGETVHASGRLVMPGFVDAHSHADARVLDPHVQHALLRQGVTTVVTGQDGVSFAPGSAAAVEWAGAYFRGINDAAPEAWRDGLTVAEYRRALGGTVRINTTHLLPHGTMRYEVAGLARDLSAEQRKQLVAAVEDGLADGACGLSTGLHYVPGLYGDAAEFADVSSVLAAAGRPYVSHMRGYGAEAWVGMAEVSEIAARSGVAVHISHLHGPANMVLQLVQQVRDSGVDITFDAYPYMRGFTLLSVSVLPDELRALDPHALVERLGVSAEVDRLCSEWFPSVTDLFDRAVIASASADEFRGAEGLSLADAAAQAGADPARFTVELLRATGGAATAVIQQPPLTTEADVRTLMRSEAHMGGSDGIFLGGRPHPRAWATFARFLARHTRELGDWTWGQAALHLAGHPARRFGLTGRGVLRPGLAADVVLVDPEHVRDTATYADPRQLADGIDDVWVNGSRVLRAGELTDSLSGRALTWGD